MVTLSSVPEPALSNKRELLLLVNRAVLSVPPLSVTSLVALKLPVTSSVPPVIVSDSLVDMLFTCVVSCEYVTSVVPATSGMTTSSPACGKRFRSQLPARFHDALSAVPVHLMVTALAGVARTTAVIKRHAALDAQ